MSKQVNFFLTARDTETVEAAIRELGDVLFVSHVSMDPVPVILPSLMAARDQKFPHDAWMLLPHHLPLLKLHYVPEQEHWLVDGDSPAIEASLCYAGEGLLRRGRFYFRAGRYVGREWEPQPEDFVKWADKVLAKTRRMLKLEPTFRFYAGPEALALAQSGKVRFTQV